VLNIVLVEPEIPQNCGNIARTCAATGSRLHLIRPLGFDISDRAVKRAGLDYWHLVEVFDYKNLDDFFAKHPEAAGDCWLTTTKAPFLSGSPVFSRLLDLFRQGDGGAAHGFPGAIPGTLYPSAHDRRGPEPESQQHRGGVRIRSAASESIPRPAGRGGNGRSVNTAGSRPPAVHAPWRASCIRTAKNRRSRNDKGIGVCL